MADDELTNLRSILTSVSWAVGKTIMANGGWDPRPGSQAATEIADQGPFVRRSRTPVLEAHSISIMRLASATEHFDALARLTEEPVLAYGPASLARTVLENSARAWWALDPTLDVRMRIARGRTDVITNLQEAIRTLDAIEPSNADDFYADHQQVRDETVAKLSEIVDDTEAIGLHILRTKKGVPVGVEERPIGATAVITKQLGDMGRIAFNDLSAVAHGTLHGMTSRLEVVGRLPETTGVSLATPNPRTPAFVNLIAVALLAYQGATDRRMELYGWSTTHWRAWKTEANRLLLPLVRGSSGE